MWLTGRHVPQIGPYLDPKATSIGPWYVVAKDPNNNIVYASNQYDEDVFTQARSEFYIENLHWIAGRPPTNLIDDDGRYRLMMKIRHGPKLVTGTLRVTKGMRDEPINMDTGGIVELDSKDGGLAPGQYVAFYTEDAECLGGGIISEQHWAKFLFDAQDRVILRRADKMRKGQVVF
jgi:tRNA U34 2-thiouridine synthase MnmA/TrmU